MADDVLPGMPDPEPRPVATVAVPTQFGPDAGQVSVGPGLAVPYFEDPPDKAGAHWALKPMMWEVLGRCIDRAKPKHGPEYAFAAFFAGVAATALVGWLSVLGTNQVMPKYVLGLSAVFAAIGSFGFGYYEKDRLKTAGDWHTALVTEYESMTKIMHDEENARAARDASNSTRTS